MRTALVWRARDARFLTSTRQPRQFKRFNQSNQSTVCLLCFSTGARLTSEKRAIVNNLGLPVTEQIQNTKDDGIATLLDFTSPPDFQRRVSNYL